MAQRFIIKLPNFMQCVKVRRYIQGPTTFLRIFQKLRNLLNMHASTYVFPLPSGIYVKFICSFKIEAHGAR